MSSPLAEGSPARRRFLAALAVVAGALVTAAGAVPLLGSLLTPLRRRRGDEGAGFVRVAHLSGLPEGRPVRVAVVAARRDGWALLPPAALGSAWLLRRGGEVAAFSAACPHLACGVESDGVSFHCPCHGSAFDLGGAVRGGPAPRGLDPLEVRLGAGDDPAVELRWQRFAAGTSERRPV
jgi:Rieske Fe-S protein